MRATLEVLKSFIGQEGDILFVSDSPILINVLTLDAGVILFHVAHHLVEKCYRDTGHFWFSVRV